MKISIVTPNYNYGQYIGQTIESVVQQNYENIEHIIVDDGSTDNSVEIIKGFQEKYPNKIKLIIQKNQGQSSAINVGLRAATGDIIGWINSDDYYLPNSFKVVAKRLANKNIDAIYSNVYHSDSNGNIIKDVITQNSKKWMSLFYCFIPSNTFFFKRVILDKGIFIDNKFEITMDKEFFAHIYYSGYKIKKVNAYFAHFRWHNNNKSIDTKEVKLIRLDEGIEIFNRYSGFKIHRNYLGYLFYKFFVKLCGTYRTISIIFKVGVFKTI